MSTVAHRQSVKKRRPTHQVSRNVLRTEVRDSRVQKKRSQWLHKDQAHDDEPYDSDVDGVAFWHRSEYPTFTDDEVDDHVVEKTTRNGVLREYHFHPIQVGGALDVGPVEGTANLKRYLHNKQAVFNRQIISTMNHGGQGGARFQVAVQVMYKKDKEDQIAEQWFLVPFQTVLTAAEIPDKLKESTDQIIDEADRFTNNGSNWVIQRVVAAKLSVAPYNPSDMVVGDGGTTLNFSGSSWIDLPPWIKHKKAVVNPDNEYDNFCFAYCMEMAYLHELGQLTHNGERTSRLPGPNDPQSHFKYPDIVWPMQINDLPKFEHANKELCFSLQVLVPNNDPLQPFLIAYTSKVIQPDAKHVKLLLISKGEESHYTFIKDINRLLSEHQKEGNTKAAYDYCPRCLRRFDKRYGGLAKHMESQYCINQDAVVEKFLPKSEAYITFKNWSKTVPAEYLIAADNEALLMTPAVDGKLKISKRATQKHVFSQFACTVYCTFDPSFRKYYSTRPPASDYKQSEDGTYECGVGLEMWNIYERIEAEITAHRRSWGEAPIHFGPGQKKAYLTSEYCHICKGDFVDYINPVWTKDDRGVVKNRQRVPDHDHLKKQANFIGAAHSWCNLQRNDAWDDKSNCMGNKYKIPIAYHNFRGYDCHFLLQHLRTNKLACIPQDGEKFLSINFLHYSVIDSMSFLQCSLEKAVVNLKKDCKTSEQVEQKFEPLFSLLREEKNMDLGPDDPILQVLLRKGELPYDYLNNPERYDETCLPPRSAFHNKLKDEPISDEDYAHAQNFWRLLKIKTLGEYSDWYLFLDVALLMCCMVETSKACYDAYGLEAFKYVSAPALSYDACLKSKMPVAIKGGGTKPFTVDCFGDTEEDREMFSFFEATKRGGISQISGREAEIGLLPDGGQLNDIVYMDITNLYGYAMTFPLPIGDYQYHKEFSSEVIETNKSLSFWGPQYIQNMVSDTGRTGQFWCVDLHYPDHLHDYFTDYPPAPINRVVDFAETSPDYKGFLNMLEQNHDGKTPKLILDLLPKQKYCVKLSLLQLYVQLGVVVTKVHEIITYTQAPWVKDFVDSNTERRKKATSQAGKDVPKLINNSFYGKMLQDNRKHADTKPFFDDHTLKSEKKLRGQIRSPFFKKWDIINDDMYMIHKRKKEVKLDKPLAVGIAILDLSKQRMYDFYYNIIKKTFGERASMLMTDTDSMVLKIARNDPKRPWYHDFIDAGFAKEFDFNNYPKDHAVFALLQEKGIDCKATEGKLGTMKDEAGGLTMEKFVGLKAKMYGYRIKETGKVEKRAKGIKKHIVQQQITFEKYEQALRMQAGQLEYVTQTGFQSQLHQIHTTTMQKQTISPTDSKRWIYDLTKTLPYGHKNLRKVYTAPAILPEPELEPAAAPPGTILHAIQEINNGLLAELHLDGPTICSHDLQDLGLGTVKCYKCGMSWSQELDMENLPCNHYCEEVYRNEHTGEMYGICERCCDYVSLGEFKDTDPLAEPATGEFCLRGQLSEEPSALSADSEAATTVSRDEADGNIPSATSPRETSTGWLFCHETL